MTIKIAINGLGRIGRCVLRAVTEMNRSDIEVVAVNGPAPIETHLHLLKYDSVHGRFNAEVSGDANDIVINGKRIPLFQEREIAKLDWAKAGADIVLECTGKFNRREEAALHLANGAKKVLVSAPAENADATIVYGVNNPALKKEHSVISVGSCTTNCLAPVAKVMNDAIGIESGFMTTIHAYTGDQNLVDGSHKDLRRARAAAMAMVPTSTGAAKALGLVLPELAGKLNGTSVRVPTPNVSLVDLVFVAQRETTKEEVNEAIQKASDGVMKEVLGINSEPLVSLDFNHDPRSAIFDTSGTNVTGGRLVRVMAWYDNEWGFSNRMLDVTKLAAGLM